MADPNDTIDPNDLDSIDALLDEAELEAVSDDQGPVAEETDAPVADGADSMLDDLEADLDLAELDESTPEVEAEVEPEPEPEPTPEPEPVEMDIPDPEPIPEPMAQPEQPAPLAEAEAENFLQKRAAMQQQPPADNNMTVAEMDAIKKLIIIFSSVTIVLVLTGIGIGVWGALASGGGIDEETKSTLEGIQEASMQSMIKAGASEKSVKAVEKKLDALSFQIEQLNGDLGELEMLAQKNHGGAPAKMEASKPAMAKTNPPKETKVIAQPVTPTPPAQNLTAVTMTPELAKKLDKVSSQMVTAQRRIAEVNRRVKSLQTQYKSMLKSVKKVEKEIVAEQVKVAKNKKPSGKAGHEQFKEPPRGSYQNDYYGGYQQNYSNNPPMGNNPNVPEQFDTPAEPSGGGADYRYNAAEDGYYH